MEWLYSLFFEQSSLQAVIVMAIIIAAGLGLGKIRIIRNYGGLRHLRYFRSYLSTW